MYNIVIPDQHDAWYIDVPDSLCLTVLCFLFLQGDGDEPQEGGDNWRN